MGWKDDNHGKVFKSSELKLYFSGSHTWAMKLSQLHRQSSYVRIITYSLPNMEYVKDLFHKRPFDISIICHSKFRDRAKELKKLFPQVNVAVKGDVHSKILLIEPETIYVTSANFGKSNWHETCLGARSKVAHDEYVQKSFNKLWDQSEEIFS